LNSSISTFSLLFHFANLMAFLAFLLRDQLQLRLLMAVSFFMQGLYYYAIPGGPLFDPLFWKIVSFAANLLMIILVFGGRLDFGVPQDLRGLFDKISVLSPGQFRKLIAHTERIHGNGEAILEHDKNPKRLYFLLSGEAQIIKQGIASILPSGIFLGEIAFLNETPASATVILPEGSYCLSWNSTDLHKLLNSDQALNIAMRGVFNSDLASKLANSLPIARGETV
jgi:CRP-like cAMP-binding protein